MAGLPSEPASSPDRRAQLCWSPSTPARCPPQCQLCPGIPVPARSGHLRAAQGQTQQMTDVARASHKLGQFHKLRAVFLPLLFLPHSTTAELPLLSVLLEQCLLFLSGHKQVVLLIQQSHPCPYTVIYKLICVNPKKHMILQK